MSAKNLTNITGKAMTNRFDFEQKIMACWGVVEDIQLTRRMLEKCQMLSKDYDRLDNLLVGFEVKYQEEFEELFEQFEELIKQKQL